MNPNQELEKTTAAGSGSTPSRRSNLLGKLAGRFAVPVLTSKRIWFAFTVAAVTDAIQLGLGPLGWAFIDESLDVIAMVLTFLSVADLLLLQVRERQQEIGLLQAVGWRPWAIQRLFVQEGLFLALIGTISGVLVSLLVLSAQHSAQNIVSVPLMAGGVIVLMAMVSVLAILPAMRAVSRMEVVDLLRAG